MEFSDQLNLRLRRVGVDDVARHGSSVGEFHGPVGCSASSTRRAGLALSNRNACAREPVAGFWVHLECAGGKYMRSDVQPRAAGARRGGGQKRFWVHQVAPLAVFSLPAVAVRALENGASPKLLEPLNGQHLKITHACAQQNAA